MCLFTHVAAGAVVGALSPTLYAVPFLALGSHIALDAIPHLDIDKMRYEILFASAAIAAIAVGGALDSKVLLGIIFGLIPDFENLLWKLGKIRDDQKIFPGHRKLIPHGAVTGGGSLIIQAAASMIAILVLIRRGA